MKMKKKQRVIKGSRNQRVLDFNKEIIKVLDKSTGKMTDELYTELEGLTF